MPAPKSKGIPVELLPATVEESCRRYLAAIDAIEQWQAIKDEHAAVLLAARENGDLPPSVALPDGRTFSACDGRKTYIYPEDVKLEVKLLQERAKTDNRCQLSVGSPYFRVSKL